jgi:histone deacetylase complex regulatory component SIN3|uniref:Uncharacterized protein n=1 Tax=Fagus sylvatica TaxID=28930 RepID=A0A2N9J5F9_FAGSY
MNSNNNEEGVVSCVVRGVDLFKKIEEGLSSDEAYQEFLSLFHKHTCGEIQLEPVLACILRCSDPGLVDEFRDFVQFCQTKMKKETVEEEQKKKHDSI